MDIDLAELEKKIRKGGQASPCEVLSLVTCIRRLVDERDISRRDYECMNKFREHAEMQCDMLREALEDLEEMASECDDGQYMDYPGASGVFEKARAALKATEAL